MYAQFHIFLFFRQVMSRHRNANPNCPFIRNMSDNVPLLNSSISVNESLSSISSQRTDETEARTAEGDREQQQAPEQMEQDVVEGRPRLTAASTSSPAFSGSSSSSSSNNSSRDSTNNEMTLVNSNENTGETVF